MKEGIHPKYYQATAICHCGNTFVVGSTKEEKSYQLKDHLRKKGGLSSSYEKY